MRSGSSLLEHILSSNKDILGMGERGSVYREESDFDKLEFSLRWSNKKLFTKYKYVVDQVLHDDLIPNSSILNSNKLKVVFLLRSPLEAISSLENLGGPQGLKNIETLNSSVNYYKKRLTNLIEISRIIDIKSQHLITYENLILNPNQTLAELNDFFKLKSPLNQHYKVKKTTGILGDRSPNIKHGSIKKTNKKLIKLEERQLKELSDIYSSTLKTISSKCKK